MTLRWEVMRDGVEEAWDAVVQTSPTATFFQRRAWAEVIERTFPRWRPAPVALEFSDGNVGVLPLMRHAPIGHRESMPPHVYGGPVFLRPPGALHLEAAQSVATWYPDVTLVDNPFCGYRREQDGLARWQLTTTATDLRAGFDTLWGRFRDSHRRHVRSAERQGVTSGLAESLADVDAYYAIYRDSLRRWGAGARGFYPRALFRNLFRSSEFGRGIRLLLARKDGAVIGGIVVLHHGTQTTYWHGASHAAHASAHPSPFLLVSALREACAAGQHWFDFGSQDRHMQGVQHFKDGFASQRLVYDAWYSSNSVRGLLFTRYRTRRERRFHRCPL